MKIKVGITYRDERTIEYECVDNPGIADWITLYLPNLERLHIPRDAVQAISVKIK